jgi:hypothetical protein
VYWQHVVLCNVMLRRVHCCRCSRALFATCIFMSLFYFTVIALTQFKPGTVFANKQGHTKSQSFHFRYTKHIYKKTLEFNKTSTNINISMLLIIIPPLWSSGQSFWLQIQRSRVRFPALPDFLSGSGSGTGCTQPREVN